MRSYMDATQSLYEVDEMGSAKAVPSVISGLFILLREDLCCSYRR